MSGNGHLRLLAVGAVTLALAGCGGDSKSGAQTAPPWAGPPRADDSVRDARYTLEYQRNADGEWRLRAADYAQRCQAGRGHQDFSPKNCV